MTSSILQDELLNTTKEDGVLSEISHSSTGGLWLDGVVFFPCLTHGRSLHENLQLFSITALV
jgi:hypothetical protein